MRRSTLLIAPLIVLALVAGCDRPGDNDDNADADLRTRSTDDVKQNEGPSCLAGSWQLADMSVLRADQIESLGGSLDYTLKFDASTISLAIIEAVPVTEHTEALNTETTATASYTAADDKITVSDLTGSVTINGAPQPDSVEDFSGLSNGDLPYHCNGDELTLDGEQYARK